MSLFNKTRSREIYIELCQAFYTAQTNFFITIREISCSQKIDEWKRQLREYIEAINHWKRADGHFIITYGTARDKALKKSKDSMAVLDALTKLCAENMIGIGNGGAKSGVMGYVSRNLIKHAKEGNSRYRLFLIPLLWLGEPGSSGQTEENFKDDDEESVVVGPPFAEIGLRRYALNLLVALGRSNFKGLVVFIGGIGTLDEIAVHLLYTQLPNLAGPYGDNKQKLYIVDTKINHPEDGEVYMWSGLMKQLEYFWVAGTAENPKKHNVVILRIGKKRNVTEERGFEVIYDTAENLAKIVTDLEKAA